ncbi:hypothetical protein NUW54_g11663 [Trametes sanguinea]|uniref:Uncharacterized protein n=1 Tax=Trametes sanguinea TaxID=158606 RepID=A0ACC1NBN2_9APHY|nr:hypothetical protein NUW54_g11663 [Trametes sanguinea]
MVPFEALAMSSGRNVQEFANVWQEEIQRSMAEQAKEGAKNRFTGTSCLPACEVSDAQHTFTLAKLACHRAHGVPVELACLLKELPIDPQLIHDLRG